MKRLFIPHNYFVKIKGHRRKNYGCYKGIDSQGERRNIKLWNEGDLYKVKTFKEITKLEKNGLFVYESVPGTVVTEMKNTDSEMSFMVEGWEDSSITVELEPDTEYKVFVDGTNIGKMKSNLAGKISVSIEVEPEKQYKIQVVKL